MKYAIKTTTGMMNTAILLIRMVTGAILFAAGAGKVLQWFGGFGMETTVKFFSQSGINAFWAYVSSYVEFIGGFLIVIGLFTRIAAFALFINMLVATVIVYPMGFLTNAAYPLTLTICFLALTLTGALAYSVDSVLQKHKEQPSVS